MIEPSSIPEPDYKTSVDDDRRKFLAACGKFAVVTPPALTILLSTSLNSKAIAQSSGGSGSGGDGGGLLCQLLCKLL